MRGEIIQNEELRMKNEERNVERFNVERTNGTQNAEPGTENGNEQENDTNYKFF